MQYRIFATLLLAIVLPATFARSAETIVTVGGAATEIVYALGAGDRVVGRDLSSVYPPESQDLPEVGYVRGISAEGVLALEPGLIVATHELGPPNVAAQLKGSGVGLLTLPEIDGLESLAKAIELTGEQLEHTEEAATLIAAIRADFEEVRTFAVKPRVLLFMMSPGSRSLRAAGLDTKADAIIKLAGGVNAADDFRGYKTLAREAVILLQPDVILIAEAETADLGDNAAVKRFLQDPAYQSTPAVREKRVHSVPLSRTLGFGPRLGQSVRELNDYFAAGVPNAE
ncbi:MAG: hemin ABC transporter substrate-binding protein [Opitutales bacterium]